MKYLLKVATEFCQLVFASSYPTCRGCLNTNPYATPDKDDNTFFCRECKSLGATDPSPPPPTPAQKDSQDEDEFGYPILSSPWDDFVLEQTKQLHEDHPQLISISKNTLIRMFWEQYVDAGGTAGKPEKEKAADFDSILTAVEKMLAQNPDVFTVRKGRMGGVSFDWEKFNTKFQ